MAAIYVRDVDESLVRKVKAQAALNGQTISAYVIAVLEKETGEKTKPRK